METPTKNPNDSVRQAETTTDKEIGSLISTERKSLAHTLEGIHTDNVDMLKKIIRIRTEKKLPGFQVGDRINGSELANIFQEIDRRKINNILKELADEGYLECRQGKSARILVSKPPRLPKVQRRKEKPIDMPEMLFETGTESICTQVKPLEEGAIEKNSPEYKFLEVIIGRDIEIMPEKFDRFIQIRWIRRGNEKKFGVAEVVYIPTGLEYEGNTIAGTIRKNKKAFEGRNETLPEMYRKKLDLAIIAGEDHFFAERLPPWLQEKIREKDGSISDDDIAYITVSEAVFAKQIGLVHVDIFYISPDISLTARIERVDNPISILKA